MADERRVEATPRGVGLLGTGGVALVFGVLLGLPVVTMIGGLLLALVGLGFAVLTLEARAAERGGLDFVRRVVPHPVTVGATAVVEVALTAGSSWTRLDNLDVAEQAARELSGPAGLRARVHRARGSLRLTYQIEPEHRGRWTIGPLQVQRLDAFGTTRWAGPLGPPLRVAVRPRTSPLNMDTRSASTDLDRAATGSRMPAADDALLRDYRTGDDLRRVHWRSSARRNELLVRQDERSARRPVSVVLDIPSDDDAAEWSISVAASAAVALVRSGHRVRLLGGDVLGATTDHHHPDTEGIAIDALLDQSVDLTLPRTRMIRDAWLRVAIDTLGREGGGAELVFAVVGGLDPDALAALARLGDANLGWAMVRVGGLDRAGTEEETHTLKALRRAGWTACSVQVGEPIGHCWDRLLGSDERAGSLR
jgi:uncharacterized protein (DUF58 family)